MQKSILFFVLFFSWCVKSNYATNNIEYGKNLLIKEEKFVEALQFFTNELIIATKNNDQSAKAENIYWMAECLFQLKNINALEKVIDIGDLFMKNNKLNDWHRNLMLTQSKYLIDIGKEKDAIQLLQQLNNRNNISDFILKQRLILADAYYRIGNPDGSKKTYEYILTQTKDTIQIAQAYNGIGSYFFIVSQFDSARIYYNKALILYSKKLGNSHTRTAQTLYNLSLITSKFGDNVSTKKYREETLKIYQSKFGNHHPKTAEAYGALGSSYMTEDNVGKSIFYFKKEEEILKEIYGTKTPKLIYNYLNIVEIYITNKEFLKAEENINNAILLIEKHYSKKSNLYTQSIVKLVDLLTQRNEFTQVDKLLNEVIIINIKNPDDYIPDVYLQLGINHLAQKKYNVAIQNFKKANEMYVNFYGDKNAYSIDALTEISNTYLLKRMYVDALKYATLAKEQTISNDKIILPYDHWETILQELKCKKEMYKNGLITTQKCKADIELIKSTLKEANRIKQTYYSNSSQLYYNEKIVELNEIGIYLLTHFYNKQDDYFYDNLLSFAENNKANLLRNKISTNASNQLLPEHEQNKLFFINERFDYFISLQENQEETSFNLTDSILFYQDLQEIFIKNVEKNYPKVYALKYGKTNFSIKQIQQQLKEDFTFLMYCNDAENYYCLSISKQQVDYKICGNKHQIDSTINIYHGQLIHKKFDIKLNQQLSQILLPKKMEYNIIISSDGLIQNIAFDALVEKQNSNYLIYNHTIKHAFSSSTYFNHQPKTSNKNTIAFFPNFDNTKFAKLNTNKEAETLNAFSTIKNFKNKAATKAAFLDAYKTANVIHIASHLTIDTISPLESSLVFQPNQDYLLSINDIWKLNTNTQLITLAACFSNFGKTQNGEGQQNFAWAFQYAGVHNVLSTQWNASDKSTSNIICNFYKNLNNGKTKEEALRLAKIDYLKNTDAIGIQPFFWAHFNLFGDENQINISPNSLVKRWWIFILLLILCYLAVATYNKLYRKKKHDHL